VFQPSKRPGDYQGYRAGAPDHPGIAMPVLIGAAMIATAILLSTLITAVGTRFVGMESPTEETMWLIDRLTGSVYKCEAAERGKASCEAEIATGSVGGRPK
jgi:ethanolamine utilization microcompartment shell protein EutL